MGGLQIKTLEPSSSRIYIKALIPLMASGEEET
jgi:hypothetical protein